MAAVFGSDATIINELIQYYVYILDVNAIDWFIHLIRNLFSWAWATWAVFHSLGLFLLFVVSVLPFFSVSSFRLFPPFVSFLLSSHLSIVFIMCANNKISPLDVSFSFPFLLIAGCFIIAIATLHSITRLPSSFVVFYYANEPGFPCRPSPTPWITIVNTTPSTYRRPHRHTRSHQFGHQFHLILFDEPTVSQNIYRSIPTGVSNALVVAGPTRRRKWRTGPYVHRTRREQRPHHTSDTSLAKDQQTFGDCRPKRCQPAWFIGTPSFQNVMLSLLQQLKHISLREKKMSSVVSATTAAAQLRTLHIIYRLMRNFDRNSKIWPNIVSCDNGVDILEKWLTILLIIFVLFFFFIRNRIWNVVCNDLCLNQTICW